MTRGHAYTAEERKFMAAYVPGHGYGEIQKAFAEKFGWEISEGQVKSYVHNHRLNTGRTGRFEKGHVPANKGKKGACAAGSEKGWFKKGHVPKNHRPVGSERVNRDGYVEVKVAEPDKWALKHRVAWEAANGKIPGDCVVIFKDNDKTNADVSNLMLVKKGTNAVLNRTGLCACAGEFKETAVKIAELKSAVSKAKRREGETDDGD